MGAFSMAVDNINFSVQGAMLIAAGFTISIGQVVLGVKDVEKILELAATSNLSGCSDFAEAVQMMDESE
jgi:hypothetical protein